MNHLSRSLFSVFVFISLLFFSSTAMATLDNKRDEVRLDSNLNSLDRINSGNTGTFPTPGDWEREASAGFLGEGEDQESYEDSVEKEKNEIDSIHNKEDQKDVVHQEKLDKLQAKDYQDEKARQARLDKLDQEKLERDRADSQREIDRFNQSHGPASGWTAEENAKYNELVEKNANLNQPTAAEQEKMNKQTDVHHDVHQQIKAGAQQMGMMDEQSRIERENAYRMGHAATTGWRNFTFTGQMVNQVEQDIHNQREKGIVAKSMVIASELYLRNPNLTPEQKKAAEQILAQNKFAMGAAADAISKDIALIGLGVTADVGMLGVGKAITKVVGAVKTAIVGGETAAVGGTAGVGGAAAGGKAAGTEAGAAAGAKVAGAEGTAAAGAKTAGQEAAAGTTQQLDKAAQEAVKKYGSLDAAADDLIGGADDVVMPAESAAAQAEMQAIKDSVKAMSSEQANALANKTGNLTPTEIIQKAEILAQREATKQAILKGSGEFGGQSGASSGNLPQGWAEGGTVIDNAVGPGGTQPFKGTIPIPGQGAAGAGTTQPFSGAITLPHPGPVPTTGAAGGTTQAFGGVMPIPGGGAATATVASEAATVSGNLTGQAANAGTTQAFKGVLPIPGGGGATAASEAATVSGNLTGQAGNATQGFKGVLPIPGGGGATAASEAATVSGNLSGNTTQAFNKVLPTPQGGSVPPGVNPGGVSSEASTVQIPAGGNQPLTPKK